MTLWMNGITLTKSYNVNLYNNDNDYWLQVLLIIMVTMLKISCNSHIYHGHYMSMINNVYNMLMNKCPWSTVDTRCLWSTVFMINSGYKMPMIRSVPNSGYKMAMICNG